MTKTIFSAVSKMAMAVCCAVALFASCQEEVASPVASVALDETSLVLFTGQTHTFVATVLPDEALDKSVTWASADPTVASISENGELKALKTGETTVTVTTTDGGFTAECAVEVLTPMVYVQSVSLDKSTMEVLLKQSGKLVATITPADATVKDLVWTSANPEVAEVTVDGQVVPKSVGQTVVTVTTVEGGKSATCVVSVDASDFTVTFETNGAGDMAPVIVPKGETVSKPQDPVRESGLAAGLYEGQIDPDGGAAEFAGWYTDFACEKPYNFQTPVTADITLYAKWEVSASPIDISSADGANGLLCQAMAWIKEQTFDEKKTFTFIVTEDNKWQNEITFDNDNVTLYLVGQSVPRTLSHTWDGTLLYSGGGHIYIGKNIILSGEYKNSLPIRAHGQQDADGEERGGSITLLEGAKISGVKVNGNARAIVHVESGACTFTIAGGEIVDNEMNIDKANTYHAPVALNWGKIVMNSGKIANNKVTSAVGGVAICGGIFSPVRYGQEITKTAGVIENNTASFAEGVTPTPNVGQNVLYGQVGKDAYVIDTPVTDADGFTASSGAVTGPFVKK